MSLTPDQLTAIDRHLRKENWLLNEDLITELTDHYANGLSERLANGTDFDAAIRQIHRDFGGRKGLLKMEEDFQKSQAQHYGRIIGHLIASYFRLPRLGITFLLFMLVYSLLRLLPNKLTFGWDDSWLFIGLLGSLGILYVSAFFRLINHHRQADKTKPFNQSVWLFFQGINSLALIGVYLPLWFPVEQALLRYPLLCSVSITLFVILELAATELLFNHIYRKWPAQTA